MGVKEEEGRRGREGGWEVFFFFKQKTAYEIYQCDWSSDVCSSDLFQASGRIRENRGRPRWRLLYVLRNR